MQEGFLGQLQAEIFRESVFLDASEDLAVLGRIDNDGDIFVVLCRRTDHGRTADIDVFDGFCQRHVGLGNGFTERIQIDRHQIDPGDAVFLHGFHMFRIVADGKDAAVDLRMQGLDAAVHHFRKARHIRDGNDRNACVRDGFHRAAGGNDFHAQFMKASGKFHNACFIGYTD